FRWLTPPFCAFLASPGHKPSTRAGSGDAHRHCRRPQPSRCRAAYRPRRIGAGHAMAGTYPAEMTGEPRTGLWGPVAVSLLSAVDGAKRCGSLRVSRRAFSRSGNGEAVRSTPSPRPGGRLGVKRPLVALHLVTLLLPEAA